MKISKKILAISVCSILFFAACEELELKMEQDTGITDPLMWNNPSYVDNFMVDIVSMMPSGFNTDEFGWTFYANATDEAENSNPAVNIQYLNSGNWNSTTGYLENVWNKNYEGIYKANLFLKKAESITYDTFEPSSRELYLERLEYYKSEVRFLRALFYYELVKHYGDVVLVGDTTIQTMDDLDDPAFVEGRSSFEECAGYIIDECDYIVDNELLPLLDEGADQGRPNGTAAKAIKCKTQLLLASPVYNKEITEGSAAQMEYWRDVANTAQDIAFDRIFSFGPYDTYDGTSPEVILGYRHKNVNQLERRNFPIGSEGLSNQGMIVS